MDKGNYADKTAIKYFWSTDTELRYIGTYEIKNYIITIHFTRQEWRQGYDAVYPDIGPPYYM